jgi:hypothetical protein
MVTEPSFHRPDKPMPATMLISPVTMPPPPTDTGLLD